MTGAVADLESDNIQMEAGNEEIGGMEEDSVNESSIMEDNINGELEQSAEAKPAPIKIPGHDVEVAVSSLPSLIGEHRVDNEVTCFIGQWALNDAAHELEGQTSGFEYRLLEKNPESPNFPPSGKYSGWFFLKHPAPKPGHIKIEEKDVSLIFVAKENGVGYDVSGEGQNKFGRFTIHGSLSEEGMFHVYKIFKRKPANTPKASKSLGGIKPSDGLTPREGRVRRPSAIMASMQEDVLPAPPRNVKQSSAPLPATLSGSSSKERSQRLSIPLQKCSELLKELQKQLQATYFLEPVDYVKLCLPDYTTIVKQPMDFQTIQNNLEKMLYQSHEAFAEHVRLVFKNAITYNQRRDHPVHIAAREMSNRFEEKFRILVSQLNNADYETNFRPGSLGASVTGITAGGRGKGGVVRRQSSGGGRSSSGPRDQGLPPALDISMQTIVEMQKAMKDMQAELTQIKSQLRRYDIQNAVEAQRQASHNPLTLEEKHALVERINHLDEDRMKEVIDIIKEMFPAAASADGEDIDIPIDDLDTLTLRRLESIVVKSEKETAKRRRQSSAPKAPSAKRSKSSGGMSGTPKSRAQLPPAPSAPAIVQPLHHTSYNSNVFFGANDDDIDLLGDGDEPVSMDTGMPPNPHQPSSVTWQNTSSSQNYDDLIMEVAEESEAGGDDTSKETSGKTVESEVVLKNESAWVMSSDSNEKTEESRSNGGMWGDDTIKEKEDNMRTGNDTAEDERKSNSLTAPQIDANEVNYPNAVYAEAADPAALLNQRRDEERRQREQMERTINLDQHREALYHTEDM